MTTKNKSVIGLLSVLIIILLVLIFKNNETFTTYNVNQHQDGVLESSKLPNSKYPGGGLSWESYSSIKDPKLAAIFNKFYSRDCTPPAISKMGNYSLYTPRGNTNMPKDDPSPTQTGQ
jgi:hypothetical protein